MFAGHCGIIFVRQDQLQCSWIVKILLVRAEVIAWVTGWLIYNVRLCITLLNVREGVNSWVRVTHEILKH